MSWLLGEKYLRPRMAVTGAKQAVLAFWLLPVTVLSSKNSLMPALYRETKKVIKFPSFEDQISHYILWSVVFIESRHIFRLLLGSCQRSSTPNREDNSAIYWVLVAISKEFYESFTKTYEPCTLFHGIKDRNSEKFSNQGLSAYLTLNLTDFENSIISFFF